MGVKILYWLLALRDTSAVVFFLESDWMECGELYSNLRSVRISIGRTRNSDRQPAATLAAFSVIRRRAAASIMLLDASGASQGH